MKQHYETTKTTARERYTCSVCAHNMLRQADTKAAVRFTCEECGSVLLIPKQIYVEVTSLPE